MTERLRRRVRRRDLRRQKSRELTPFKPGWSCQELLHTSATRWRSYSSLEIGGAPNPGRCPPGRGCPLGPGNVQLSLCSPSRT